MHKKFEINQTKIKGSCQSGREVRTHDSMSDLSLVGRRILQRGLHMYVLTVVKTQSLQIYMIFLQ